MDRERLYGEIFLKFAAMILVIAVLGMMIVGAIYAAASGHENLGIAIASGTGLSLVAGVIARIVLGREKPEKPKPTPKPATKKRKN